MTSVNSVGHVVGTSNRYISVDADNGQDVWVWDGIAVHQAGLTGFPYTGTGGYQESVPQGSFLNSTPLHTNSGQLIGYSERVLGERSYNGRDVWAWNGSTTQRIGLFGPAYGNDFTFQYSEALGQNASGLVNGYTERYSGGSASYNGQDAWLWNGTSTVQVGFTGAGYESAAGFRSSFVGRANPSGQVMGSSRRVATDGTLKGEDSWMRDSAGMTTQVGLVGGAYTGSVGHQRTEAVFQTNAGQVAGLSHRFLGENTDNGMDAFVWRGGASEQIGFSNGIYAGSAGYARAIVHAQNQAGQVLGQNSRIAGVSTINGTDSWIWRNGATTQIGLVGGVYIGLAGLQHSTVFKQNEAGHVIGSSARFNGGSTDTGIDAWVWNGTATIPIGLVGSANLGSTGYRLVEPALLNQAGQVAGHSQRYTGVNTNNGQDAWVWSGGVTTQIGFTGGVYSGSNGRQQTTVSFQSESSRIAGHSQRYAGVSTNLGQDAWIFDGSITTPTGLRDSVHTGTTGFRFSEFLLLKESGLAAGRTRRIAGVSTSRGNDTWYFDPTTLLTHAVIGSVRTSDNSASSYPWLLTDTGFMMGEYLFYPGGAGPGESRAFVFRPDMGFTDLGNLVAGGLSASGWQTLQIPRCSLLMDEIVGTGLVLGQTQGASVFVMVPAPMSAGVLGIGMLISLRRRRSA